MRPRVQVKYVTEHMNYLEEKIHVIKPVVEALQAAVDKSKTWLEDKSDNESLTYCDLCQELESATLALLNVAAHILDENKDNVEDGRSFSSQSNSQTTTEKCGRRQSTDQVLNEPYKPSESCVGHRYACHVALDLAPVSVGLIISRFWDVREYNGQHFNQTTGTFVSPHDGLYLVCVSLNEREDKQIGVGVMAGGRCCTAIEVKCAATSAAGSVVVDMKKGQELYFKVIQSDQGAKLSCYSSFTIVSL
ncbi:uncharacterized protein LOC131944686 isoform X2 [Physella acuta]|uniref:uncharacterized protein LOC131944686 isoform X2 n=1 Tax=Physella acuta TaxID=109671 RepID=UPI0027DC3A56|nr:uncharacterized protein LOC131944686 isoform X2 [Physella acuta]